MDEELTQEEIKDIERKADLELEREVKDLVGKIGK